MTAAAFDRPLERLEKQIEQDLEAIKKHKGLMVDATLSLMGHLKEARDEFPSDNTFGVWLDKNPLMRTISKDDRAALLNFAKDLKLARRVLTTTTRSSLQHIWRTEGQSVYEDNGLVEKIVKKARKAKVIEVDDENENDKEDEKEDNVYKHPRSEWNRSSKPINATGLKANEEKKDTTTTGFKEVENEEAKTELQEKLTKVNRKLAETEKNFETRVEQEVKKRIKQAVEEALSVFREKEKVYDRIIRGQKGVFTPDEFKLIQSLLHPDRVSDVVMKQKYTNAFGLFNGRKLQLCIEKETPKVSTAAFRQQYNAGKATYDAKETEKRARKAAADKVRRAAKKQQQATA